MRFTYYNFNRIYKACVKAVERDNHREMLRYIELRAENGYCIATALDGFVLCQVRVECEGDGVILIPPVKPPTKCDSVEVEALPNGNVKFAYFDSFKKFMYSYELPVSQSAYFDWENVMPHDRKGDRKILCSVRTILRALECFRDKSDSIVCISIPEKPEKPIALSNPDAQAIALPMRLHRGDWEDWAMKNWYKKPAPPLPYEVEDKPHAE